MTSQTVQSTQQVISTFNTRQLAMAAQQKLESAGIPSQKISISEFSTPRQSLEAQGTTIGGEAGLWVGAFFGGTLSVMIVSALIALFSFPPNSQFNRLLIVAFTIGGGVWGALYGKKIHDLQPQSQKKKGDPSIPRSFNLVLQGSQDEIDQARLSIAQG